MKNYIYVYIYFVYVYIFILIFHAYLIIKCNKIECNVKKKISKLCPSSSKYARLDIEHFSNKLAIFKDFWILKKKSMH